MSYKTYALGDLIEKWIDNRGKTPPLASDGIPLLEVKHLPASGIYPITEGTKYVDQATYDSWFRAYLEPRDILFSTVGTTARVIMTPENRTVAIAQNVLGIRFKKEILDPWYMFYYMRGSKFQHDIKSRLITTVQASIKRADMVGIEVDVPPLSVQKSIVEKVYGLDRKVDLNHQLNQTLEQMAQAIFKSWFVDFEPVKAKITALEAGGSEEDALLAAMQVIAGDAQGCANAAGGRMPGAAKGDKLTRLQTEQPEQYAELRATAELFPSAMQDSELGEIPQRWEVLPLGKMINLIGGGTPKKSEPSFWNGDIRWFSVKDVPSDGNVFVVDTEDKITEEGLNRSSTKLLPIGTTIITARGTVGKLALTGVSTAMNQSCYGVTANDETGPYLNYLRLSEAVATLKRNTHGAVFDTITRSTFDTVIQPRSCLALRQRFEQAVTPMFEAIRNNLVQSNTLSEARDSLLPKLLSGELSLDAQPAEKEVVNV
ncbi:restriction endonuclease subunit S [Marinobacter sp.]|uniref:restriction endonuclease subunit S n=1 Tax=Marinobacter sp. TaxID=50741 RepID=UPI003F946577